MCNLFQSYMSAPFVMCNLFQSYASVPLYNAQLVYMSVLLCNVSLVPKLSPFVMCNLAPQTSEKRVSLDLPEAAKDRHGPPELSVRCVLRLLSSHKMHLLLQIKEPFPPSLIPLQASKALTRTCSPRAMLWVSRARPWPAAGFI